MNSARPRGQVITLSRSMIAGSYVGICCLSQKPRARNFSLLCGSVYKRNCPNRDGDIKTHRFIHCIQLVKIDQYKSKAFIRLKING